MCCGASVPVCQSVRSRCSRSVGVSVNASVCPWGGGVWRCYHTVPQVAALAWLLSWTVPVTVCVLTVVSVWSIFGMGVKMGRGKGGESPMVGTPPQMRSGGEG